MEKFDSEVILIISLLLYGIIVFYVIICAILKIDSIFLTV